MNQVKGTIKPFFPCVTMQTRDKEKGTAPHRSLLPHEKALDKGQMTLSADGDGDYLTVHC